MTAKLKSWLITGVSSGLGRALAMAALARGDIVAGTVRREADRAAFEAMAPGRAHGLLLDLADEAAIAPVCAAAEAAVGGIDILVNNAGYGLVGALEETSLPEIRAQFAVNVFGSIGMIQGVLPFMRARRAGRIITVTSVSGLAAWGGTAAYCASKFALEGATLALAQEVADLGVKVTNVAPGSLRTDYAGRSIVLSERTLPDYDGAARLARRVLAEHSGQEPGDPAKAAEAILAVADVENPPLHLLLGADAVHYATRAQGVFQTELAEWGPTTFSTAWTD